MKYNVTLYPVVRVRFDNVEAETMEKAIDIAENEMVQRQQLCGEYADEMHYALVDVVGDEEYDQTKWFSPDPDNGAWKEDN